MKFLLHQNGCTKTLWKRWSQYGYQWALVWSFCGVKVRQYSSFTYNQTMRVAYLVISTSDESPRFGGLICYPLESSRYMHYVPATPAIHFQTALFAEWYMQMIWKAMSSATNNPHSCCVCNVHAYFPFLCICYCGQDWEVMETMFSFPV